MGRAQRHPSSEARHHPWVSLALNPSSMGFAVLNPSSEEYEEYEEFDMARIPYADENIDDETRKLIEQIKRERGGKLLNLYRMLLHSPPLAAGWLHMFTAIRQQAVLPDRYREIAILRVAVINGADYEFAQHIPFALAAGCTQSQIDAMRAASTPEGFDERDRAVIEYAESMTREIRVSDALFARIRSGFSEREIVELTATVAGYNLVSRFLEAMQIDHE